jgi:hypothetical protein
MNEEAEVAVALVASARMPRGSTLYQVSVFGVPLISVPKVPVLCL